MSNPVVTVTGIPGAAHRYLLSSRSALGSILDRYQVRTDNASGIVNDPNDWCDEHDDPTYIVDLIKRVTTVSIETTRLVDNFVRPDTRVPPLEVMSSDRRTAIPTKRCERPLDRGLDRKVEVSAP